MISNRFNKISRVTRSEDFLRSNNLQLPSQTAYTEALKDPSSTDFYDARSNEARLRELLTEFTHLEEIFKRTNDTAADEASSDPAKVILIDTGIPEEPPKKSFFSFLFPPDPTTKSPLVSGTAEFEVQGDDSKKILALKASGGGSRGEYNGDLSSFASYTITQDPQGNPVRKKREISVTSGRFDPFLFDREPTDKIETIRYGPNGLLSYELEFTGASTD
jgi:hypothetical protein